MTKTGVDVGRPSPAHPGGAVTEVGSGAEPSVEANNGGVRGTVRIAPAVLIELIALSVRDVSGVVGFQHRRRVERILPRGGHGSATDQNALVGSFEGGGIRVRIDGDRIDADVSIIIVPDINILELSRDIQRQVGIAVGRMLGMTVNQVNVYVAGVTAPSEPER